MRQAASIVLILAICGVVCAENIVLVEASYMSTTRNYHDAFDSSLQDISNIGLNLVAFNGWPDIGMLAVTGYYIPVGTSASINGIPIPVSLAIYDELSLALDMLVGPGYRFRAGVIEVLVGGGAHANGLAFRSSDPAVSPFLSYTIGAGGSASVLSTIAGQVSLTGTVVAAYDFLEFYRIPGLPAGVDFGGSFTVSVSVGVGFRL
jgi:hypothetical protein